MAKKLENTLKRYDLRIQRAFIKAVVNITTPRSLNEVVSAVMDGDLETALSLIVTGVPEFANVIPDVYLLAGKDMAKHTAGDFKVRNPGFDPTTDTAAETMRTLRTRAMGNFSTSQKKVVSDLLNTAVAEGWSKTKVTRRLRQSIGLNMAQHTAVKNYRKNLENLDKKALTNALRDKRKDATFLRAVAEKKPLTSSHIDKLVDAYYKKQLAHRSKLIAHMSTTTIANSAREEAVDQMVNTFGIDRAEVTKTWHHMGDDKVRDLHLVMNKQTVPFDGVFTDAAGNELRYPGDTDAPIETVAGCRCLITVNRN